MATRRNGLRKAPARSPQGAQPRSRFASAWVAGVAGTVVATVLAGIATGWLNRVPGLNPDTPADTSEPFTTSVEIDKDDCSTAWYVPKAPSDINFSGPIQQQDGTIKGYGNGWDSFTAAADGSPASPLTALLSIQGKTSTAVVINRLDIRTVQRRPAPNGTILGNPCGGALTYRWLAVDLDNIPPRITAELNKEYEKQHPEMSPQSRQSIQFPYKISSTDPEVFQIEAETVYCDCEWVAVLSWQSAGRSGTKIIDNHGKPFRTIGQANAHYQCDGLGRQCVMR
jgi:hypothetical protein